MPRAKLTMLSLLLVACGCATTPSFETLGTFVDDAVADAKEAIAECQATAEDEADAADCIDAVLEAVGSGADATLEGVRQICDEVEASSSKTCKGLENDGE